VTGTEQQQESPPGPPGKLREARDPLTAAFANANLRRVELARLGFSVGGLAVVQTLGREDFLRAVAGHDESRGAAENVVRRRLAV
jgi:hypothetical protein